MILKFQVSLLKSPGAALTASAQRVVSALTVFQEKFFKNFPPRPSQTQTPQSTFPQEKNNWLAASCPQHASQCLPSTEVFFTSSLLLLY